MRNGGISHWLASRGIVPGRVDDARPPVEGSVRAEVCIVGGGFTGLWLAHHLLEIAPALDIVLVEQETCGFGASGRNAGWVSPLVPGNRQAFARTSSRDDAVRLQRRMLEAVDEIHDVIDRTGLPGVHAVRSGNVVAARNAAALDRLRARRRADLEWGYSEDEVVELDRDALAERIRVAGGVGGLYYPTVVRIDPGGLVRALADSVERRGVRIHERTRALAIEPGRVVTADGEVRARHVLRCTEGYTAALADDPRRIIPINSSIIVTEPLPPETWEQIGWAGEELFSDAAHVFSYAQRTHDGRILIGGRGAPYRFASGIGGAGEVDHGTVRSLIDRLHRILPATIGADIDHAWSGVLGVTRDWCASVQHDADSGLGHAQGYAGHGVASSYLAARSLALAVAGTAEDEDRSLPWVDRQARNWEPEPLRWLGVHAMYRLFALADRDEERRDATTTSILARVGSRLAGLHE